MANYIKKPGKPKRNSALLSYDKSRYTDVLCTHKPCGRVLTPAQLRYSTKIYNKALCFIHQPRKEKR